ncbi:response regulator [uncultured Pontibacter sp.]|uniref:response regulator n=1 Tax=uncultured Pontibacter sp. TaxID=453356 RepID=UPI0026283D11|nr:response regulator [uncultured Pontibacter sp.]
MKTFSIDDDQISNFLTERALEEAEFATELHAFLSAEEALGFITKDCETNLPNIIFLDLNMPIMSGWDFLDALQPYKENLLGKCHIYILTSSLDTSDTARAREYELISGFIHKPLTMEDVQVILAELEDKA